MSEVIAQLEMVSVDRANVNRIEQGVESGRTPSHERRRLLKSAGSISTIEAPGTKTVREARLVASAQKGDILAFEELIRPLQKIIVRLGLHITGKPEDADEALQESLIKAWKNLHRFRGDFGFSTWVVRIATNEALMKLRKRRSARYLPIEDSVDDEGGTRPWNWYDQRPNPEQLLLETEARSMLLGAAQALSPLYRNVFVLRYEEGLSTRETAMALKLNSTTVKSRAHRVRYHLRYELSKTLKIRGVRSDDTSRTRSVLMST